MDWLNLIVGFVLGCVAAYAAHAYYDRRQETKRASRLRDKYGKLAHTYANYRPDGTATGGSVELGQNQDGSFKVVGINADRTMDWESVLWMDEQFENHGSARYCHEHGGAYGVQLVRYVPESGELHVKGIRESPGPPLVFHHVWRPKQ